MKRFNAAHGLAACLLVGMTGANANILANGSFETGTTAYPNPESHPFQSAGGTSLVPGQTSASAIANWLAVANGDATHDIAWLASGDYGQVSQDGRNFIDLTGYTDASPYSGIGQSVGLTIGTSYRLTFYLGQAATGSTGIYDGPVGVTVSSGASSTARGALTTFATTSTTTAWTLETYTFTANSNSAFIEFAGLSTRGGQYIGIDNVDLEAVVPTQPGTVPEPASLGLLGLGLTALVAVRRRKAA